MLSYMSLLVLVLSTFAVSPVRGLEPLEVEGTGCSESSIRSRFKITRGKVMVALGTLALVGIIFTNLSGGPSPPTDTTQTTSTPSTSPPTPTTPPRAFAGREVRILNRRGLSVDTSKARSLSDNNNQRMHTPLSLDLLSRAEFGEAFSLFSRMLDELD